MLEIFLCNESRATCCSEISKQNNRDYLVDRFIRKWNRRIINGFHSGLELYCFQVHKQHTISNVHILIQFLFIFFIYDVLYCTRKSKN